MRRQNKKIADGFSQHRDIIQQHQSVTAGEVFKPFFKFGGTRLRTYTSRATQAGSHPSGPDYNLGLVCTGVKIPTQICAVVLQTSTSFHLPCNASVYLHFCDMTLYNCIHDAGECMQVHPVSRERIHTLPDFC